MAKKITDRLQTHYGPIKFDISLPGSITSIGVESATGKSFFIQALKKNILNASQNTGIPSSISSDINISDIKVIDTYSSLSDLASVLRLSQGKLIVVDNADLLFSRAGLNALDFDQSPNQFLIFSRDGMRYGANPNSLGELYLDGDTITAEF